MSVVDSVGVRSSRVHDLEGAIGEFFARSAGTEPLRPRMVEAADREGES